jgi:hypothetical protein
MRETSEDDVLEFLRLGGNRCGNARIRVPMQVHPPGRNRIEDSTPVRKVQPDPFGADHMQRRRIKPRVCKGMPDFQGCRHCLRLLRECRAIEMVQKHLHERGPVQVRKAGNFANHTHMAKALDGFAVFAILVPN